MGSCYAPLSHSTANRKFMFASEMASNESRSIWALDSARVRFVTSSIHYLQELDRQMHPS